LLQVEAKKLKKNEAQENMVEANHSKITECFVLLRIEKKKSKQKEEKHREMRKNCLAK